MSRAHILFTYSPRNPTAEPTTELTAAEIRRKSIKETKHSKLKCVSTSNKSVIRLLIKQAKLQVDCASFFFSHRSIPLKIHTNTQTNAQQKQHFDEKKEGFDMFSIRIS